MVSTCESKGESQAQDDMSMPRLYYVLRTQAEKPLGDLRIT